MTLLPTQQLIWLYLADADEIQGNDKGSHGIDCSDSIPPQTFGMKRNIVLYVPPDVAKQ